MGATASSIVAGSVRDDVAVFLSTGSSTGDSAARMSDSVGIEFIFWFVRRTVAGGAKHDLELGQWSDSKNLVWLVAPAKEQLAAVADNEAHGISFRWRLTVGTPESGGGRR